MRYYLVYIPATDQAEAKSLAKILLEARLAACVNIIPKIQSLYWWESEIKNNPESLMIAKTREDKVDGIIKIVTKHHSYETPAILAVPIVRGSKDYLRWLDDTVMSSPAKKE